MQEYCELVSGNFQDAAVLVAEDDQENCFLMGEFLQEFGFRNLFLAADGEEAWEIYDSRQKEIALIVSDLQMPRMRGDELFWKLHADGGKARMLLCSGGNGIDLNPLFKAGLGGFIHKPFKIEEFHLAIAQAML